MTPAATAQTASGNEHTGESRERCYELHSCARRYALRRCCQAASSPTIPRRKTNTQMANTAPMITVKSLLLNSLQSYFPFNVQLSTADLVEVVIIAMVIGLALCGVTSFLTLRRYLRV